MRSHLGWPSSPEPLVSLAGYTSFWGWFFMAFTLALALLKREGVNYSAEELRHMAEAQEQGGWLVFVCGAGWWCSMAAVLLL